jgi:hypothetical protein
MIMKRAEDRAESVPLAYVERPDKCHERSGERAPSRFHLSRLWTVRLRQGSAVPTKSTSDEYVRASFGGQLGGEFSPLEYRAVELWTDGSAALSFDQITAYRVVTVKSTMLMAISLSYGAT